MSEATDSLATTVIELLDRVQRSLRHIPDVTHTEIEALRVRLRDIAELQQQLGDLREERDSLLLRAESAEYAIQIRLGLEERLAELRRENAALRERLEGHNEMTTMTNFVGIANCEYCGCVGNDHSAVCVTRELSALRNRLAEAEADRDRLEEIENRGLTIEHRGSVGKSVDPWMVRESTTTIHKSLTYWTGKTARAAIDAAKADASRGGKPK